MADGAGLRILPFERACIEARPVGIEATPSERRVAGETVSFRMTRNAALQVLPGRLAMPQEERTPGIMIPGVQLSSCAQPRIHVAVSTELRVVVAVAAVGLTRVC
jgi:hypothetical protein